MFLKRGASSGKNTGIYSSRTFPLMITLLILAFALLCLTPFPYLPFGHRHHPRGKLPSASAPWNTTPHCLPSYSPSAPALYRQAPSPQGTYTGKVRDSILPGDLLLEFCFKSLGYVISLFYSERLSPTIGSMQCLREVHE